MRACRPYGYSAIYVSTGFSIVMATIANISMMNLEDLWWMTSP
jgi:hypothetical protein